MTSVEDSGHVGMQWQNARVLSIENRTDRLRASSLLPGILLSFIRENMLM